MRPDDMAAQVVRGLLERTGVDPASVEDLILGCAFPEGEQGLNRRAPDRLPGRPAAQRRRRPRSTASAARPCRRSTCAAGAIQLGAGEAFICAGVESMTRVPMMGFNPLPNPGAGRALSRRPTSRWARPRRTSRANTRSPAREQEELRRRSSTSKAAAAQPAGRLRRRDRADPSRAMAPGDQDGCIRPETTPRRLASLKPAFDADGTVTAGTSSPLTDGAAAVLVVQRGVRPGAWA